MGSAKFEGDHAFRRHGYILIAGKSGARRSGTGPEQATDQGSLAAAGQTANQRPTATATANEPGGAFAFPFGAASYAVVLTA